MSDGLHGFDFLHGRWRVAHRRLRERLVGSQEWDAYEAVAVCIPILDGLGNVDEFRSAEGPIGASLRFFDLATQLWSIWWVSSRDGLLGPPVTGGFEHGVGTFLGPDAHDGRPVLVRFIWQDDASKPRWEQAFSTDAGATWETNWVMEFSRDTSPRPPLWPPTFSAAGSGAEPTS